MTAPEKKTGEIPEAPLEGTEPVQTRIPDDHLSRFLADSLRVLGHGRGDFTIRLLAGDGSTRRYWRVHIPVDEISYVVMENRPATPLLERENHAYLMIGNHLLARSVPVPEIYRADLSSGLFIMEDLGDRSLQEACTEANPLPLYRDVLHVLLQMQIHGSKGFDVGWTFQTERYDREVMRRFEAEYFKEAFLFRYLGLKPEWPELLPGFEQVAANASGPPNHLFLHRDFQSRNIMIRNGKVRIIDWQGGRLGPIGYDVASLYVDPYPNLPGELREEIYRAYAALLKEQEPSLSGSFEDSFPYLAIQRNLQILGAFSYLSRTAGKSYFEAYIPSAVESLGKLLEDVPGRELEPLRELTASICERLGRR
ncbi:MAG: aminoglycoside phosphotransferase [Desulfobacteraceae bacterium]|nr:MAG: aminoglycoside phosphotransferase [Desulfobacteraceae bacterium]